ncbi:LysM peptidoglycan-binding domain-containing protein [Gleimia sp. 6138-11-ORH1]|uniref:LysM peptidoglycan-binding domain-containing protein n=1 Tax=Gleimia sp. 6138-11-ORH1 TaxID=2973937 RepID=UPI00216774F4|nr:LysM peptidoglycan-binding domain-containing protein [Gleimia sp. 6138-11-ORH1]MCS4484244.1 LysM peptidoglycan-binding domain-containing protein [Gleimia sp. 6138-11-ORH1]
MSALTITPVPEAGSVIKPRKNRRGISASRGHLYVVPEVHIPTPQRELHKVVSAPLERSPKVIQRAETKTSAFSVNDLQLAPGKKITGKEIFILLTAVIFGIMVLLTVFTPAQAEQLTTAYVTTGDSLWSIAATRTPAGGDVAETVYQIQLLNDLNGETLQVGQKLIVPVK